MADSNTPVSNEIIHANDILDLIGDINTILDSINGEVV